MAAKKDQKPIAFLIKMRNKMRANLPKLEKLIEKRQGKK